VNYQKSDLIYEGKAKKVFAVTGHSDLIIQEFKNSLTAFNGEKKASVDKKGQLNISISTMLFKYLATRGIPSHWVKTDENLNMVCKKLKMIPVEVVVRNFVAGSLKKKFNKPEGEPIQPALVELYFKADDLGDPFISDEQAKWLKVSDQATLDSLKKLALQINKELTEIFPKVGLKLVDFKLEFGIDSDGKVLLGDEISPDTCRLWDLKTGEKLDKDRFRYDLGDVVEGYQKIFDKLSKLLEEK
jgi:phosphoribosylaminoimidazole-succinocarboxamide synthase